MLFARFQCGTVTAIEFNKLLLQELNLLGGTEGDGFLLGLGRLRTQSLLSASVCSAAHTEVSGHNTEVVRYGKMKEIDSE